MIERINRFTDRVVWSFTLRELAMFTAGVAITAAMFLRDTTGWILIGWSVVVFLLIFIAGFMQNRSPKRAYHEGEAE